MREFTENLESKEISEVKNNAFELPDDSGKKHFSVELPDDSGGGKADVRKEGVESEKPTGAENLRHPRNIPTINEGLEGKTYPGTDVEYARKTFILDDEKVEGVFPKFESKFDITMPKELRSATDTEQFKFCTQKLAECIDRDPDYAKQFTPRQIEQIKAGEPRISGLTWHHNEIPGKMQLVDATEHGICRHTGGKSIWGGGASCR